MKSLLVSLLTLLLAATTGVAAPLVLIETNRGSIKVELAPDQAPATVKNFLGYVESGFYNGTIFHRVIPGFMIQGGGFDEGLEQKVTRSPIKNEADNGLSNLRGTIAMARTQVVDSATSQFFINLKDNAFLDHRGKMPSTYGYAVFGKVTEGMEVVDAIAAEKTTATGARFQNLPVKTVKILSINKISAD
ncbi:MAG: peptidylprolyl isomerase [Desulfuromonadales bacterium]|uniref:peptidylprolyl isomerase n=1 Tax=Desulfuromonas sp. KJ2020 TaxID=2919173 RepID=UPI0020A719A3|nr:peptidylprolyl isomerase [Desulfuromonas sp. KJ2020]MCP3176192.1 peptidylprolyl isomerase [Desulfuromonas sp. KJ2020]